MSKVQFQKKGKHKNGTPITAFKNNLCEYRRGYEKVCITVAIICGTALPFN